MNNLDERIRTAGNAAQCLEVLQLLAQETERIITSNRVTAGEARVIAERLSQIRGLLSELTIAEKKAPAIDPGRPSALVLSQRFSDLEGRVKELRNDLDRGGVR